MTLYVSSMIDGVIVHGMTAQSMTCTGSVSSKMHCVVAPGSTMDPARLVGAKNSSYLFKSELVLIVDFDCDLQWHKCWTEMESCTIRR